MTTTIHTMRCADASDLVMKFDQPCSELTTEAEVSVAQDITEGLTKVLPPHMWMICAAFLFTRAVEPVGKTKVVDSLVDLAEIIREDYPEPDPALQELLDTLEQLGLNPRNTDENFPPRGSLN